MSVGLFKYDRDIYDENAVLLLSVNISSEEFYVKYWEKAIKELEIEYIHDGTELRKSQLDIILVELDSIMNWAIKNLIEKELEYMKDRIYDLKKVILEELIDDDVILYIF